MHRNTGRSCLLPAMPLGHPFEGTGGFGRCGEVDILLISHKERAPKVFERIHLETLCLAFLLLRLFTVLLLTMFHMFHTAIIPAKKKECPEPGSHFQMTIQVLPSPSRTCRRSWLKSRLLGMLEVTPGGKSGCGRQVMKELPPQRKTYASCYLWGFTLHMHTRLGL